MPVVERGRLVRLVSIGDLVKIHVADAEFESGAMREYITPQFSLRFDQASRLRLAYKEIERGFAPEFANDVGSRELVRWNAVRRSSAAMRAPVPST
jgi:hypothetical protein